MKLIRHKNAFGLAPADRVHIYHFSFSLLFFLLFSHSKGLKQMTKMHYVERNGNLSTDGDKKIISLITSTVMGPLMGHSSLILQLS